MIRTDLIFGCCLTLSISSAGAEDNVRVSLSKLPETPLRVFNEKYNNRLSDLFDAKSGRYLVPPDIQQLIDDADNTFAMDSPVWAKAQRGELHQVKNVRYAIVDTGLLREHPALGNSVVESVDFTGEGTGDRNGHGTIMAIISAQLLAKVAMHAEIVDLKAVASSGNGQYDALLAALDWAKGKKLDVLQMSLGSYLPCVSEKINPSASQARASCERQEVCRKVSDLSSEGVIIIAAVGNEVGRTACPACCKDSISLGSPTYNSGAQVVLAVRKVGLLEELKSSRNELAAQSRIIRSDAGNVEALREQSGSYNNIGDVLQALGNVPEALQSYRDGAAIRDRLAKSDRGNVDLQRDLSVSHEKIGDLLLAQGNVADALVSYSNMLALRESLSKIEPDQPGPQRDLSVAYLKMGDILLAEAKLPEALKSYREAHAIFDRLAKASPAIASSQRDLAASDLRIGDVLVNQHALSDAIEVYKAGLGIEDDLAKNAPNDTAVQRDLALCHVKVGDVLFAQGDLTGALTQYRDGLTISDRLAKGDPDNRGWQQDVSVAYNKIGDINLADGNLTDAQDAYTNALTIRQRLADAAPGNIGWLHDLCVSYSKVGSVQRKVGDVKEAYATLKKGHAVLDGLTKNNPENLTWKRERAWFEDQLFDLLEILPDEQQKQ